jgi:hypothetical protein
MTSNSLAATHKCPICGQFVWAPVTCDSWPHDTATGIAEPHGRVGVVPIPEQPLRTRALMLECA